MARLFVLGAGFSAYAGLPLGDELFPLILEKSQRSGLYNNILKPDLERFRRFKYHTEGQSLREDQIDPEEFISFLEIEHSLSFTGSDTWTSEGNRSQQVIKNLIALVLLRCQSRMTDEDWAPYLDFASRLTSHDWILTFNYDTILETALERVGVPYRLVPNRYDSVSPTGGTVAYPDDEVVVSKVHGSIDWFDIEPWRQNREYLSHFPHAVPDTHPIFSPDSPHDPEPIHGEPFLEGSSLRRVRKIDDLSAYVAQRNFVSQAPLILPPSHSKLLYSDPLRDLWYGVNEGGGLVRSLAIIGFSLQAHDKYALQAIYALVRNFQHVDVGDLFEKEPLRIVDLVESNEEGEEIQTRYQFVDWEKAELLGNGFDPETVPLLFTIPNSS